MIDTAQVVNPKTGWGIEAVAVWFGVMILQSIAGLAILLALGIDISSQFNLTIDQTFTIAITSALIALLPVKYFMQRRGGLKEQLGLTEFKKSYLLITLVSFVIYALLFVLLFSLVAQLYPNVNLDQDQEFGFNNAAGMRELILSFISLVIVTPIFEEIIYRGLLYKGIANGFGFWFGAIISSAIFGLMHGQLNVGIDTFVLGMVACYTFKKTSSLWPAILLHSLKNLIAFSVIFIF